MCTQQNSEIKNRSTYIYIYMYVYIYSQLNITKVPSQFNEIGNFFKQMTLEQL